MVEHMSGAIQTTHQHQSFNGVQTQRWHHRHHHHHSESPDLTIKVTTSKNHRFSLFKWFKRRDSTSSADNHHRRRHIFRRAKRRPSTSSTSSSVDTFYSTATVRSFAFHSGVRRSAANAALKLEQASGTAVGPFAPGACKLIEKREFRDDEIRRIDAATTSTLPSAFLQRQDLQTRYSLLPVSSPFISYDSIPIVDRRPRTFAESRRTNNNKNNTTIDVVIDTLTSDSSASGARRVHVKGKRRAPDPPTQRIISVHVASASGCSKPAGGGRRKRRPAPKPPGYAETLSSNQDTLSSEASLGMDSFLTTRESPTISNDTLVLRRGVLLSKKDVRSSTSRSRTPTTSVCDSDGGTIASNQSTVTSVGNQSPKIGTIMPRPWYKRNSDHSSHSNTRDSSTNTRRTGGDYILRGLSSPIPSEIKIEDITPSPTSTSSTLSSSFPFEGSLSRLGFFHRGDRHHHDDKKKENKRKSGVSILTNISELDKEAAAIVQEEQARNRASMLLQAAKLDEEFERRMGANEEIVQEIVNSSMESSPRRSTRALISKFNALGNITNGNFFGKNNSASPKAKNKRYSQECNGRQNSTIDEKLEKDLSRYFLPHHSSPKRDSAAIFTEVINPGRPKTTSTDVKPITMTTTAMTTTLNDSTAKTVPITITTTPLIINTSKVTSIPIITPVVNMPTTTNVPITLTTPTVKTTPATTSSTTTSSKIGTQDDDAEFVKTLAAELDDVASGIAKLRRELDDRPRLIDSVSPEKEKVIPEKKKASEVLNKPNAAKERDLAKFDKEFTKIFDEIDRQLKTRDIRIPQTRTSANASETSISNQVAKVLDILVGAEKDAAKNFAQSSKETNKSMDSENTANKEPKPRVQRISGVDDKTTAELKEMLKEMKHSLPKRPKPKRNTETDEKSQDTKKPAELINNKPSSSVYHVTEEIKIPQPKVSTKVSSGVQTSGNVRRIEISPRPKESNVIPEIPKAAAAVAAARNNSTYQLIKANEFEAAKSKARLESAYANVIERSLYANAQADEPFAARAKIDLRPGDSGVNATASTTTANSSPLPHRAERKGSLGADKNDSNEEGEKLEEIKKQYMNTLAVNRLLRKLEAAIASGNHQQAAVLAKELAQLKIHCSVVRQRSCSAKEKLNLSMYIEDKQAHQGPIPLQLPAKMTVAQLKAKIHIEFEIPANVQRWIIGKNLADNDESTLEELQAVEGSPVFLYLVAPPDLQDKEVTKVDKRDEEKAIEVEEVEVERASSEEKNDEPVVHEIKTEIEPRPMPVPAVVQETATAKTTTDNEAQQPQAQENEDDDSLSKEEKLKRYEELMSLENCDVILNTEPIECPVCFMITIPGEGVILRDCLHSFCRMCVANTVRYCEEAEVKCPYRDADYTCESTLQEREIKALVAPEVYQQHLAKSIAQAENNAGNNAFHCKTPDCPGWCIYDDNVNNFLCPVCKVNNCLTCQAIHMGKNCRQYQEELKYSKDTDHESKRTAAMLEEMVDRGEALPCPTCAVVLMKKWGCDWLRCSMCKTEICWVTRGPRWGPGGKGDTSGGCRCGENGVKCHPKCNYCH